MSVQRTKKPVGERFEVQKKRKRICMAVCGAISAALIVYVFIKQGLFYGLSGRELLRVACDACVVCGLIFTSVFVLNLCHYHGAFDFMFYGVSMLGDMLFRKKEEETINKFMDFATYLRQNSENKRLNKIYLWFGLGFLVVGVCFLILYVV